MSSPLGPSALDFAKHSHASQRRHSDGAPFIEHPMEVAQLLRAAGCSEDLVAAGLLHDIIEDTEVSVEELTGRFGSVVAGLVRTVSEDASITGYRPRKRALREQVRRAGGDAALLFAADKISKVREFEDCVVRRAAAAGRGGRLDAGERLRLEHYERSLEMLRSVVPRHVLVSDLADELAGCRSAIRSLRPSSRRRSSVRVA